MHEAYDEADEAQFVVNTVQRLASSGEATLSDCAVMYRTNAIATLEDAFVARRIYRLVGGNALLSAQRNQGAAYLRLVPQPVR
jgi:superfamily I DNA/RNA helicase